MAWHSSQDVVESNPLIRWVPLTVRTGNLTVVRCFDHKRGFQMGIISNHGVDNLGTRHLLEVGPAGKRDIKGCFL